MQLNLQPEDQDHRWKQDFRKWIDWPNLEGWQQAITWWPKISFECHRHWMKYSWNIFFISAESFESSLWVFLQSFSFSKNLEVRVMFIIKVDMLNGLTWFPSLIRFTSACYHGFTSLASQRQLNMPTLQSSTPNNFLFCWVWILCSWYSFRYNKIFQNNLSKNLFRIILFFCKAQVKWVFSCS